MVSRRQVVQIVGLPLRVGGRDAAVDLAPFAELVHFRVENSHRACFAGRDLFVGVESPPILSGLFDFGKCDT